MHIYVSTLKTTNFKAKWPQEVQQFAKNSHKQYFYQYTVIGSQICIKIVILLLVNV